MKMKPTTRKETTVILDIDATVSTMQERLGEIITKLQEIADIPPTDEITIQLFMSMTGTVDIAPTPTPRNKSKVCRFGISQGGRTLQSAIE
jgi:hypothetical protein